MALTQYFFDGVLKTEADNVTPGFTQAVSMGLLKYMGNARESESGLERPLMILLSRNNSKTSERILADFEDALELFGIEHADAKDLPRDAAKFAFFDLGFDNAIHIEVKDDDVEIDLFERGDEIGGIEASLPGGVNFEGKVLEKIPYGIPLPQIAINQIEHTLNTETGSEIRKASLHQDFHEKALEVYKKHQK